MKEFVSVSPQVSWSRDRSHWCNPPLLLVLDKSIPEVGLTARDLNGEHFIWSIFQWWCSKMEKTMRSRYFLPTCKVFGNFRGHVQAFRHFVPEAFSGVVLPPINLVPKVLQKVVSKYPGQRRSQVSKVSNSFRYQMLSTCLHHVSSLAVPRAAMWKIVGIRTVGSCEDTSNINIFPLFLYVLWPQNHNEDQAQGPPRTKSNCSVQDSALGQFGILCWLLGRNLRNKVWDTELCFILKCCMNQQWYLFATKKQVQPRVFWEHSAENNQAHVESASRCWS